MAEEVTLETYQQAWREMKVEEERTGFKWHLTVYVVVNAALAGFNLIEAPDELWFFYPLIGWGIGLAFHFFHVHGVEDSLRDEEAVAEKRARELARGERT